jgi:6-phosphogluconolactonase/glucosamine-6-phosphate isomerase/deaminase
MGHDRPVAGYTVRVAEDAPGRAAAEIAPRLAAAVKQQGAAALAVSGGSAGPALLAALAAADLPWAAIGVWQVDERVAPDGDPDRNANQLETIPGRHVLMPVTAPDLAAAADAYAAGLPARFDVIHLGMGPDGHTASWPPGDPVIHSTRPVDLSGEYQGRVRMTLTPPVVDAARARVVLIVGADKAAAVARWLQGDEGDEGDESDEGDETDLPIARLPPEGTVVVLDPAAAAQLRSLPGQAIEGA